MHIQGWAKLGLQLFIWEKTCRLWSLQQLSSLKITSQRNGKPTFADPCLVGTIPISSSQDTHIHLVFCTFYIFEEWHPRHSICSNPDWSPSTPAQVSDRGPLHHHVGAPCASLLCWIPAFYSPCLRPWWSTSPRNFLKTSLFYPYPWLRVRPGILF